MSDPITTNSIFFKNLEIDKRRISLVVSYERGEFELWYEFDREINTTSSLVALAVAPLCGTKFDQISFGFEITPEVYECLQNFTRANITVPGFATSTTPPNPNREGTILSFSGGFDSISAKALMSPETHLVSLDLGGWFKREAEYFKRFNPITIKTNIRQVPDQLTALTRNNWLFMATGALLCASHLNAKYHVFGSILGERFAHPASPRKIPLLECAGLVDIPVTAGITEIGTTKIMLQTHPEEVAASLKSLANDGDRKQYYKQAMVSLMTDELGMDNLLPNFAREWDRKIPFDRSYTSALSTLYFIAKDRLDLIEPLYDNVPTEAIDFARSHHMDFMTKVNTDFYEWTPKTIRSPLFEKFSELDLLPYSENDWFEVHEVRSFLSKWFKRP